MTQPRTPGKPKVPNRRNTFNLDTLEKDAKAPKPLPVILEGQEFVFEDIDETDRADLKQIDTEDADALVEAMLGEEQYTRFSKLPMPGWKWDALWKQIDDHFGYRARAEEGEGDRASHNS